MAERLTSNNRPVLRIWGKQMKVIMMNRDPTMDRPHVVPTSPSNNGSFSSCDMCSTKLQGKLPLLVAILLSCDSQLCSGCKLWSREYKMDPVLPEGCPSPILQPGEITQAEQDASAALAIIMCILSSLGSLLIILSYVLIKSVRTKAREILVHISVMDLTYSVANLIGAAVDFDTRMRLDPQNAYLRNACTTDGWFAIYGTTGSVLWTIGLAIYLYFKVITIRLHPRSQMMRALTVGLYLVGYILPLFIAMYFYALGLLGSNKFLSSGWCTVDVFDSKTQERFILPYLIGYDMWMYMAIILIPLLVIATKYQIDSEVRTSMSMYLELSVFICFVCQCISNCMSLSQTMSLHPFARMIKL